MRPTRLVLALAAPLVVAAMATPAAAQPFADGPDAKKKIAPRPDQRSWSVKSGKFAYTFEFKPGIPKANEMTEIRVFATAIPPKPDPRYGNRIPLKDATFTIEAINPAGESVGRYRAHAFPLQRGRYGLHITPTQAGLYELILVGKTGAGKKLSARLKLPVDVWPLPKELQGTGDEVGGARRRRPILIKK